MRDLPVLSFLTEPESFLGRFGCSFFLEMRCFGLLEEFLREERAPLFLRWRCMSVSKEFELSKAVAGRLRAYLLEKYFERASPFDFRFLGILIFLLSANLVVLDLIADELL